MQKNLEQYVINFKNFLGTEICNQTVLELSTCNFNVHSYSDTALNSFSYPNDLSVSYDQVSTNQTLMDLCWQGLLKYHQHLNLEWYAGWQGYEKIRYNKYEVGTEMRIHCDHIHTLFDGSRRGIPVLTLLGCLNEDYEGGDLIMFTDTKVDFKTGDLLIFPSNFLYPHEVTKITKGTRYSFVSWSW